MARALVVDDDAAFLSLAGRLLENAGIEVIATAATAADALAKARDLEPDAMLVDVGLPDRSGIELGRELFAMPWGPRVVLTSTDRDALAGPPVNGTPPFVPKEDLPNAPLRELLAGD